VARSADCVDRGLASQMEPQRHPPERDRRRQRRRGRDRGRGSGEGDAERGPVDSFVRASVILLGCYRPDSSQRG
jgi:hypothetical protein